MPNLTLYHLDPGGAFHLGRRGVGQEETGVFISADTLFAAFLSAGAELGREPGDLAACFGAGGPTPAEVPLLLTSAFPRAGALCFYPALPLNRLKISDAGREDRLKELKAIRFFSEAIFEKAVAGETLDGWLPRSGEARPGDQGLYLQGADLWLTAGELEKLPDHFRFTNLEKREARPLSGYRHLKVWKVNQVPRVTVDRISNSSTIYHTGRLRFNQGCGLWFGIAWLQPDRQIGRPAWPVKALVEQSLSLLADAGLGGERSAGYGLFQCQQVGDRSWPDPQPDRPFVTLSRYHPQETELPQALQAEAAAYRLVPVGGWLQAPGVAAQRRRRLQMIEEGGIIQAIGPGPWGDISDVRPRYSEPEFKPPQPGYEFPHPIWRYGLACPVLFGGAE